MATRLGLHVTAEELAIWQTRAVSGPYKTTSDVSTNSPGDWDRIAANALTFKNAAKPYQQWAGQVAASCYNLSSGTPPGRGQGENLNNAAFYYLVKGDTAYGNLVVTDLLAQAAVTGTNFADTVRWCHTIWDDPEPAYGVTMWLTKLLFAYDYVKGNMTSGQRTTMETWFHNAGTYWEANIDLLVEDAYPNRDTDNYTNPSGAGDGLGSQVLYYGGPTNDFWGEHWNNRSSNMVRFFTLVGIMVNDTFLIDRGKRWFKEWIKYNVYPDGTAGEFYQWPSFGPCNGWDYASYIIGDMIDIADALARTGDTELYTYSTSVGRNNGNHDTSGGPKSIQQVFTRFLEYADHTVLRYGTATAGNNGNANYLIDSFDDVHSASFVSDSLVVLGNLYFQSAWAKTVYMRTATNTVAYPAVPESSGWNVWGGAWGAYPGVMFMFAQNEGVVNPYSLTSPAPNAPSGLTVHWV